MRPLAIGDREERHGLDGVVPGVVGEHRAAVHGDTAGAEAGASASAPRRQPPGRFGPHRIGSAQGLDCSTVVAAVVVDGDVQVVDRLDRLRPRGVLLRASVGAVRTRRPSVTCVPASSRPEAGTQVTGGRRVRTAPTDSLCKTPRGCRRSRRLTTCKSPSTTTGATTVEQATPSAQPMRCGPKPWRLPSPSRCARSSFCTRGVAGDGGAVLTDNARNYTVKPVTFLAVAGSRRPHAQAHPTVPDERPTGSAGALPPDPAGPAGLHARPNQLQRRVTGVRRALRCATSWSFLPLQCLPTHTAASAGLPPPRTCKQPT